MKDNMRMKTHPRGFLQGRIRVALEAIGRILRDVRSSQSLMGGLIKFIWRFLQILPVIIKGTKADEIRVYMKSFRI